MLLHRRFMGKGFYRIFQQFIKDKLLINIPSFVTDIEEKLGDFKKYADEKKTEIIESTQNEIEEIYIKIKKAEETNVKPLIE